MNLSDLSDELILLILNYTDIPDLLDFSRTCRRFLLLSRDPILHAHRLQAASYRLSESLRRRPSISSLLPPSGSIYLSNNNVLVRSLSRQLVSIRLKQSLLRRPSATSLVKVNILPIECCRRSSSTGEVIWGEGVSPSLVDAKRRVERERVKDGLRAWLERKATQVQARAERSAEGESGERMSVRGLIRWFTARRRNAAEDPEKRWMAKAPWGRSGDSSGVAAMRVEPTRAHVHHMRRFWESKATEQAVQA